ncbi:hypothetical protein B566_EDAN016202 [Ephemera danica]|nr:hypothetical protein B566_EDAN016202 [Ephemera danica]
MRQVQKLRNRPHGVSIISLAIGQKVSKEEELAANDPFKVKAGGMIDMRALKSGQFKQTEDAYDVGIGTQFSAETNTRDEDEEMMKYIEEELTRKKGERSTNKPGGSSTEVDQISVGGKYLTPEEAALQSVPDHLRASSTHRSEEMLSNQMLSGIPEVDLGIEAKIKNIEATEEAKMRLLWERNSKKDTPSQFVPTNMAVNFVQHNRFNIEDAEPPRRRDQKEVKKKEPAVVVGLETEEKGKRPRDATGEKATDDYHYEKFKKQFRRY